MIKSAAALCIAALLAGCGREEIKSYRVTKDAPAAEQPNPHAALPEGHPPVAAAPAQPKLSWELPFGWIEAGAGQMSVASFLITNAAGQQATVAITPLRGLAGKEAMIVNMWRQQVGLSPLSDEDAAKELSPVDMGTGGQMFNTIGTAASGRRVRITTALQVRGDSTWFFKLAGDDELVQRQKPSFIGFLKSVKFTEATAADEQNKLPDSNIPAMGSAPTTTEAPASSGDWKTPADWKAVAPGPMQAAKFSVPDKDGAKADVTVSVFPNSTGGFLGNVNRWRGQIGLPPVDDAGLAQTVKPLDDKTPDSALVDLSNNKRRLVGAIVPRGGQWYFFKLLGDDAAVAAQKDAFIAFVKSPQ